MRGDASDERKAQMVWFRVKAALLWKILILEMKKMSIKKSLKDDRDYWLVAWLNGRRL